MQQHTAAWKTCAFLRFAAAKTANATAAATAVIEIAANNIFMTI